MGLFKEQFGSLAYLGLSQDSSKHGGSWSSCLRTSFFIPSTLFVFHWSENDFCALLLVISHCLFLRGSLCCCHLSQGTKLLILELPKHLTTLHIKEVGNGKIQMWGGKLPCINLFSAKDFIALTCRVALTCIKCFHDRQTI